MVGHHPHVLPFLIMVENVGNMFSTSRAPPSFTCSIVDSITGKASCYGLLSPVTSSDFNSTYYHDWLLIISIVEKTTSTTNFYGLYSNSTAWFLYYCLLAPRTSRQYQELCESPIVNSPFMISHDKLVSYL